MATWKTDVFASLLSLKFLFVGEILFLVIDHVSKSKLFLFDEALSLR